MGLQGGQFSWRRRQAREIDRDDLIIDVIVQPHVEAVDGEIARLATIPFVANVQLFGPPWLEPGIAAVRRPRVDRDPGSARRKILSRWSWADAAAEVGNQVGAHVVHARPRHHPGQGKANAVMLGQVVVKVQARKHIRVGRAFLDRKQLDRRNARVDAKSGWTLLLPDHLDPEIPVEVARIDGRLRFERQDIFLDIPRFVEVVRILQLDDVVIVAAVHQIEDLDTQNIHVAGESQRRRACQEFRSDQALQPAVLQKQVELFDGLVFMAMSVIEARLDTAKDIAEPGIPKILLQGQIAGSQRFLDTRRLDVPFGTVTTPGWTVAKRNLARIGIIQPEVRILKKAVARNHTIVAVENAPVLEDVVGAGRLGIKT